MHYYQHDKSLFFTSKVVQPFLTTGGFWDDVSGANNLLLSIIQAAMFICAQCTS